MIHYYLLADWFNGIVGLKTGLVNQFIGLFELAGFMAYIVYHQDSSVNRFWMGLLITFQDFFTETFVLNYTSRVLRLIVGQSDLPG